uniref:Uncharacterized protein n=1 Tax=Timema monikensis TaxID=170555 RepID=A0A7R9EHD0_9NEOP|nr:unnamed protein product [Timema monikensis]
MIGLQHMMTLPFHFRRLIHCSLLLCLVYIAAQIVWSQRGMGYLDDIDREARLKEISRMLQPSQQQTWRKLVGGGQACRHPHLEVHNRDIMKFIKPVPPIDCGEKADWVQINGSTAYITDQARSRHGDIECAFTDIIRSNDHAVHDGITTQTHTEYNLEESDFVKVHCKSSQGDVWHNVMAGVRHDQDVLDRTGWDKVSSDNLHLNVLIWGFDSLSHNMFIRKLPRSYHYMRDTLQAIELHGYNIVGDGTPQALIPILTEVKEGFGNQINLCRDRGLNPGSSAQNYYATTSLLHNSPRRGNTHDNGTRDTTYGLGIDSQAGVNRLDYMLTSSLSLSEPTTVLTAPLPPNNHCVFFSHTSPVDPSSHESKVHSSPVFARQQDEAI